MKNVFLNMPGFAFVLGTRAALAAGVGLLVAGKLSERRRWAIGSALVAIGAATTVPAAMMVVRGFRKSRGISVSRVNRDESLIGATRFPRKGDDIE